MFLLNQVVDVNHRKNPQEIPPTDQTFPMAGCGCRSHGADPGVCRCWWTRSKGTLPNSSEAFLGPAESLVAAMASSDQAKQQSIGRSKGHMMNWRWIKMIFLSNFQELRLVACFSRLHLALFVIRSISGASVVHAAANGQNCWGVILVGCYWGNMFDTMIHD